MNPLQEYPEVRRWAYRFVWVVGLVLGAISVYTTTTEANDTPGWLVAATAVLGYLSIATNYTADRNVSPTTTTETDPADRGFTDGGK